MKTLTDQQQKWIAAIALIIVPFLLVHISPHSQTPRIISLIWVSLLFPLGLIYLIFFTRQPVRLRNYSNPVVEKRLEIGAKIFGFLIALIFLWSITMPVLTGIYGVYLLNQPFTILEDSVSDRSAPILASGIYWNVKLIKKPGG
jgi:hypothetical protein